MPPHTTEKPGSSDNLKGDEESNIVMAPNLQNLENPSNQTEMVAPEFITRLKCSAFKNEFWWQNFKKSPKDRLSYVLDNGIMTDVTLEFKDGVALKFHTLILSMYSPVYATSFHGSFKKSDKIVEVTTSSTFAWVANFMYKGIFTISDLGMANSLYAFAHEKRMDCIVLISRTYMLSHVNLENVFTILDTAVVYEDKILKDVCIKIIFGKRGSIFFTDESNIMSGLALRELIREGHQSCSESMFFKKIHSWAVSHLKGSKEPESLENLKEKMWPLLALLEFKNIPIDFMIKEVMPSNIISPEDGILLLRTKVGDHDVPKPKFMKGEVAPRKIRFDSENTKIINLTLFRKPYSCITSFQYSHFDETFTGNILQLTCSGRIFLRGVKALTKCYFGSWKMFITDSSDCQVGSLSCEGPPWKFDVMIPLSPTKKYKAKITGKGRFNKHPTLDYEESLGKITFTGDGIGCGLTISYHLD